MSWAVAGLGKPIALATKFGSDFDKTPKMQEPEQTGFEAARSAVMAIVPCFPPNSLIRVECNGIQYCPHPDTEPGIKINSLMIKIESMGSIIE